MEVTPEVALRWLEKNTHNRDLKQTVVELYAEAMKRGEWKLTFEPIAFAKPWTDNQLGEHPETLINGQHRLWAVIESKTTQKFTVWWGCEPEEFSVIDQGPGRTQGDVLKITRRDVKNPTRVASAISVVRTMLKGQRMMTWETELVLMHFQREIELVVDCKHRLGKFASRPVVAALFASLLIDEAKIGALVERLHSAVGFTERDPVRALHLYLTQQLTTATPDPDEVVLYKSLNACLAQIDGRPLQRLQPHVDYLGDARRRIKAKIDGVVKQLHEGKLPDKFYHPRGSLHAPAEAKAAG